MTQNNDRPVTAAEFVADLAADSERQERAEEFARELEHRAEQWRAAETPILDDLSAVGVDVRSVWDLVNTDEPYPEALAILMEHLEYGRYPDRVMEGVGRALAVKPAVEFWHRLVGVYRGAASPGQAEGAAVALAACAAERHVDELIGLLSLNERAGTRLYFLRPIRDLGGARGRVVLEALCDDADLGRECGILLGRGT